MLIIIVGLAGLLSFGSASMMQGITGNEPRQEERIIAHTIGTLETTDTVDAVKQESAQTGSSLPIQAETPNENIPLN
jgi:hypothetical protein